MKKYLILICILILAVVLRFYNLPNNPPGLTWDEAALGYNAYSIMKTGKDEYGSFLPLNLKSFGDYKPALYAYLDIPFIAVFGLNELAVRLPSAIFGVLSVLLIYFFVLELFKNRFLALLSALFISISPISIQFSRPAYEAAIALFLNLLGTYLFIKGLNKNKFFPLSGLAFGLSLFTYQGSRIFVPLLIFILLIIYRKEFNIKKAKMFLVTLSFFVFLLGITFLTGQTGRLSTLNFFAYQRSDEEINLIAKEDGLNKKILSFEILHGEWWKYTSGLVERYLVYFSPKMLFVTGDYNQRQKVPDLGAIYYFSLILIPIGLVSLLKRGDKQSKLILFWLLIAPIPAVLSRDLISLLRAINIVIPITVLEAVGLFSIINWLKVRKFGKLGIALTVLIIVFNISVYLNSYFIHAPIEYSKYWLYGYKQLFEQNLDFKKYNKVAITDIYGQPYIYYLFYTKYPPAEFQKQAILDQPTVDVGTVRKIDNIEFRHVAWPTDRGEKNSLFISNEFELPKQDVLPFEEFKLLKEINFLDGGLAFMIVETKK